MSVAPSDGSATAAKASPVKNQRWQRFILWALLRLAAYLQRIPRANALRFGERLGNFVFFVCRSFVKRPYDYAHRNLRLTQMPYRAATFAERDAFVRRVFQHFCKGLVEFLRVPAVSDEEAEAYTRLEGAEYLDAARAEGRGVIIVTGHFGNWEHIARLLTQRAIPLTVVARESEEPGFAEWVKENREKAGYRVLHRGASVREVIKVLRRGEAIAILPDQNADDIFIPFFGIPTGTSAGPATLALHTGATILFGYCVFAPDGTYYVRALPPIDTTPTGDRLADITRITVEINRVLEDAIRQYPEQWLWLHNRWKNAFEEVYRARAWGGPIDPDTLRRWEGEKRRIAPPRAGATP